MRVLIASRRRWRRINITRRNSIRGDLPDGLIFRNRVKPSLRKYFALSEAQIRRMVSAVPLHQRGVSRSSRTLAAGCDGRGGARDERAGAYGEIVRSRSPDAGIKPCVTNARRRWLEARHTEEITYKPSDHCAGNAGCSGCPVVACVREMQFPLHARPAGAASIRCSLRPLPGEGHE
jgi:hypothetical protein